MTTEPLKKYAGLPNARQLHTIHSAPEYFRSRGVTGNVELLAKAVWQKHREITGDATNNYLDEALPVARIAAIADLIAGERVAESRLKASK